MKIWSALYPEQRALLACTSLFVIASGLFNLTALRGFVWWRKSRRLPKGAFIPLGPEWLSDVSRLRHTHMVGATGTGKTVAMEKLIQEDIKRGYGCIIIDPKGEREFYESIRRYCASVGRLNDLVLLSASYPDESAVWNPCSLGNASELQTKFLNSSIYSEPHYAKACEFGLMQAFNRLIESQGKAFTLHDVIHELKRINAEQKDDTLQGLFFDLNNLVHGEWGRLLAARKRPGTQVNREVSIIDLVSKNKILFVDLPTEGKKVQSSRIGRLLTQEIILISGMRKRNRLLKGDRPYSVFIDEFDAFATESFASFLNKGRSSDFMITLAHQTLSDLNCISPEFAGQILGNCNVRFIFRQDDPDDAERWSRFIGTKMVIKRTFRSKDGMSTGESSNRESLEFVISPDRIKTLPIGTCVFVVKTEGYSKVINIPFAPSKAKVSESLNVVSASVESSVGQVVKALSLETLGITSPMVMAGSTDYWKFFPVQPLEQGVPSDI